MTVSVFSKCPLAVQLIEETRILVVGAGGIGCELLKNLVLQGFLNIDVIDLDTIDVTNLNRQFLFRREHVNQPKSKVAVEACQKFVPRKNKDRLRMVYHHGNIISDKDKFSMDFFEKFDVVLNALDNEAARAHVNRVCVALSIPLLEAGTIAYEGQSTVHIPGETECFECNARPKQKTFAPCTIRDTPEKPIHCITWSKNLFDVFFGPDDEENLLSDLRCEVDAVKKSKTSDEIRIAAIILYDRIFRKAIEKKREALLSAEIDSDATAQDADKKPTKTLPKVLQEASVLQEEIKELPKVTDKLADAQGVWSIARNYENFVNSIIAIKERSDRNDRNKKKDIGNCAKKGNVNGSPTTTSGSERAVTTTSGSERDNLTVAVETERGEGCDVIGEHVIGESLQFTKEDELAVDFVTSAGNLRAENYDIPRSSRWETQSLAGNIVPAIATTNGITAALQVGNLLHLILSKIPEETLNTGVEGESLTAGTNNTTIQTGTGLSSRFVRTKSTLERIYRFERILSTTKTSTAKLLEKYTARDCRDSFIKYRDLPTANFLRGRSMTIVAGRTRPPKTESCMVCGSATMFVTVQNEIYREWRLVDFVSSVLKKQLFFSEPSILVSKTDHDIQMVYSSEFGNTYTEEAKSEGFPDPNSLLSVVGIVSGTLLTISDDNQDKSVDIVVKIVSDSAWQATYRDDKSEGYFVSNQAPTIMADASISEIQSAEIGDKDQIVDGQNAGHDVVMVLSPVAKKRKTS